MLAAVATGQSAEDPLSGLSVTGDHPEPEVAEGWELVEVRAATVNHHELWSLRGVALAEDRLPMVLGSDAAGVTSDGREVVCHAVITEPDPLAGDEMPTGAFSIFSEHYQGTHAERVAVPRRNLVAKPAELTFAEAACLPTAYLTAYRMLFTQAGLRPGGSVLVQGVGGGVSTAAILLARAAGLWVYATSRDEGKRARAVELGAHEAFEAGARLPERLDAVMETVGEATWAHSLRSVRAGGAVVVAGATSGWNPPAELNRVFARQLHIVGSTMGTRAELGGLVALLAATGTRPVIDSVWPLSQAAEAYARMKAGEVVGKLVLTP
jgi:NADPH:quinone reductase-like Zn-dependent oxidoreductase